MNLDAQRELERAIDRELQALPEVAAPPTLLPRVMAELARRSRAAAKASGWSQWPTSLRVGALAALVALFGAVWFGIAALWQPAAAHVAANYGEVGLAGAGVWKGLNLLAGALVMAIKSLGTPVLIGCFSVALMAYVVFVGLASCYVKLGLSRKEILWRR